jgi:hypothetical protein
MANLSPFSLPYENRLISMVYEINLKLGLIKGPNSVDISLI